MSFASYGLPFLNYTIKYILSDAKSHEEHDEKDCDEGLRSYGRFCAQVQSNSRKRIENSRFKRS